MKAIIHIKALKKLISATKGFISPDSTRIMQRYIKLDFHKETASVTAAAVDGYRMSIENSLCASVDEDFSAYIKPDFPIPNGEYAIIEIAGEFCNITVDDCLFGLKQPKGDFLDYQKTLGSFIEKPAAFRIGFNGDYLLSALQAAKVSCGSVFRQPVILEFRSEVEPILLKTNSADYKVVLPVRIKG